MRWPHVACLPATQCAAAGAANYDDDNGDVDDDADNDGAKDQEVHTDSAGRVRLVGRS